MRCKNCGNEIPDGSGFCSHCGATQTTGPAAAYKKNHTATIVWIISAILIIAAIALVLIFVVFPDGIGGGKIDTPAGVEDRDDNEDTDANDDANDDANTDNDAAANDDEATATADDTATANQDTDVTLKVEGYDTGEVMPDFTIPMIDGGTFLLSEHLGKPVFINIFATWCPPCVGEMPEIEELYGKYGNDVTFIIVDLGEDAATAKSFATDNGYTLPFGYSEDGSFLQDYYVDFIPQSFVLAADGTIMKYFPGASDYDGFESAIIDALEASS
jgi:cytochrome c-type biogenesis protein